MVSNFEVIKHDHFSFSMQGNDWVNVKWLFEVIIYFISLIGGAEFVPVLQAAVNLLLLTVWGVVLKKIYADNFSHLAFVCSAFMLLLVMDYRMTGRPEMISHLFSAFFVALLLLYKKTEHAKYLWFMIPIQILWTNLHEAYGTGPVIYSIFLAGTVMNRIFKERKISFRCSPSRAEMIVFFFLIISMAVSPRGFYMIYHPYEIFTQLGDNKYTTELYNISTSHYFEQKETYLFFGLILLVLSTYFFTVKRAGFQWKGLNGFEFLLIPLAFAYLGFSAHRNIAFFPAVSFYLIYQAFYKMLEQKERVRLFGVGIMAVVIPVFYFLLVSNTYYKVTESRDRFGLELMPEKNPTGLSKFLKENNLEGDKIYSDFLISNYLMWYNRPHFKTLIDLRDLDVFPVDFFNVFLATTQLPRQFEELCAQNDIQAVALLNSNRFGSLHSYLYSSDNWEPVFADEVAVLYVKNVDDYNHLPAIITKGRLIFADLSRRDVSIAAKGLTKLLNPFYGHGAHSTNTHLKASYYLTMVNDFSRAYSHAKQAVSANGDNYEAQIQLALVMMRIMGTVASDVTAQEFYESAFYTLKKAMELDSEKPGAFKLMGELHFMRGNTGQAVKNLKKAIEVDKSNSEAYIVLANVYSEMINQQPSNQSKYVELWFENMENAFKYDRENAELQARLGLSYCQMNDCKKAAKYLKGMKRLPSMDEEEYKQFLNCKKRCL